MSTNFVARTVNHARMIWMPRRKNNMNAHEIWNSANVLNELLYSGQTRTRTGCGNASLKKRERPVGHPLYRSTTQLSIYLMYTNSVTSRAKIKPDFHFTKGNVPCPCFHEVTLSVENDAWQKTASSFLSTSVQRTEGFVSCWFCFSVRVF